tara:strand:+ start:1759 stop:2157 length:399 start_codon:yes stop_codon:yes gene_type:complete
MVILEIINTYPIYSLASISFVVTLFSTLAHKWLTNQEHLKHLKKRQKEIQKELKSCKDECLLKELNSELMSLTGLMFKSSFKPMFVTIIPLLALFAWLRGIYSPLMGNTWLWYYIGFSVLSSLVFRKIFKVA